MYSPVLTLVKDGLMTVASALNWIYIRDPLLNTGSILGTKHGYLNPKEIHCMIPDQINGTYLEK